MLAANPCRPPMSLVGPVEMSTCGPNPELATLEPLVTLYTH